MYRYNNLLSVPELRADPHRREPISPEVPPSRTSWPRDNWLFQDFPEMATENSGILHGRTSDRHASNAQTKLGVADLPARQTPKPDTAICSPSPGAVCERMLDVLRPRELGPRGHVVFTIFPISQERATGKSRSQQTGALCRALQTMP
ncbi:hypothetical protein EVAR_90706_1 [Eumeta japonica]|uniref:Uncharacterized protein n=1 Tax=Eumeta variegata TaxID=151549 RepID=A0A4C1SCM1_EUMVA|nr:hypothetical protein EVAR_90706_1 [Eumeta japonica]